MHEFFATDATQSPLQPNPLYLDLNLDFNAADFLQEIEGVRNFLLPHRSSGAPDSHRGWNQTCLRGLERDLTAEHKYYGFDYANEASAPLKWTIVAERCPKIVSWIQENLPMEKFHRIRIMELEAGGYILPHRDRFEAKLNTILLSVSYPSGCRFKLDGVGLLPLRPGMTYVIDNSRFHSIWNDSPYSRYQIQVLGDFNAKIANIFDTALSKNFRSQGNQTKNSGT